MVNSRKILGGFLVVIGLLFLLANNNLLWFGWEALWPIIPFLLGLAMMGMYRARRKPRQIFFGILLLQFGVFFFLFTSGILPWERMTVLWPTFPLMLGVALLALAGVVEESTMPLIVGMSGVIFAVVSYLFTTATVNSRVAEPIVRFWPVLLVAAGGAILWRARQDQAAARRAAPADAVDPVDPTR